MRAGEGYETSAESVGCSTGAGPGPFGRAAWLVCDGFELYDLRSNSRYHTVPGMVDDGRDRRLSRGNGEHGDGADPRIPEHRGVARCSIEK